MTVNSDCKENIRLAKSELRIKNKQLRKETFSRETNSLILEKLRKFEVYRKARKVLAFFPLPYEVDLSELFVKNEDKKDWFLPKFCEDKMYACKFCGLEFLIDGNFNTKEPAGNEVITPQELDLIILPALAADEKGNRLGYGKGCYDTFLSSSGINAALVLPIQDNLIVENVPVEPCDKKVHVVLSEKRLVSVK